MDYHIREMNRDEYSLLSDFLYEAIFVPQGAPKPDRSILTDPQLQVYIDRFGELSDDAALIAEADGKTVGAVWVRIMEDYGHIDNLTPSFAISLFPDYRGLGIGSALMLKMLALLKQKGYQRASLAVQKANYAVKIYRALGFKTFRETEEEYIMVINF